MLKDKVSIITGAAGALGSVATRVFLENGADVVALYHTEEKFRKLNESLGDLSSRLYGVKGDASVIEDCEKLVRETVDRHGRVDILVNLVGGWMGGKVLHETGEDTWNALMDLNAKSVFLCCKSVLPYMVERNYGKIVNISAKSSTREGRMKNSSVYAASKGAVRILTQAISEELKEKNINVNCVMPSTIDTEANRRMIPRADFSKWVPPHQIAETILFLCSDKSTDIKGACIPVYGRS
jgi:NAD(P)-dependent dehydrogenase (short-subunit alcohol dehydrogenase family)